MNTKDAANLTRRLDLLKPIGQNRWKVMKTVWADVKRPRITTGAMVGSSEAVVITQGVTIRDDSGVPVKKGWRVRLSGEQYDILHIDTSVARELTLTCKAVEVKT